MNKLVKTLRFDELEQVSLRPEKQLDKEQNPYYRLVTPDGTIVVREDFKIDYDAENVGSITYEIQKNARKVMRDGVEVEVDSLQYKSHKTVTSLMRLIESGVKASRLKATASMPLISSVEEAVTA